MVVYVEPLRLMVKFLDAKQYAFHVGEGATLDDLFVQIDRQWGDILPNYLWDRRKLRFRTPVLIICDGSPLRDRSFPLADGMKLQVITILSGG